MPIAVNDIPDAILTRLNAKRAVLITTDLAGDEVQVSSSLEPEDLHPVSGFESLAECRRSEQVHAITMTVLQVDEKLIRAATEHLKNRFRLIAELDTLVDHLGDVYLVYAITHFNPQGRPYGPMTVNIGGDCYRDSRDIRDLASILKRTRDLAEAMVRKAVMIFPHVPALHGGKKGEWIILDRRGNKIEGLSDEAIIALGSAIIPRGIGFLNRYKEQLAAAAGICEQFPESGYIRPDSGSPDVLSGSYWRGENPDKYINMCDAWDRRGEPMRGFTCLPQSLGGTLDPSSRPTGYGVATTAAELAARRFAGDGRGLGELNFLLEAAGGVGQSTVESLVRDHGVPAERITVFDRQVTACRLVRDKYGVRDTVTLAASDFYDTRLPELVRAGRRWDVWVNNGQGDNTLPGHVAALLGAGVRVFCGGANNFLQLDGAGGRGARHLERESLERIFAAGAWAWPDEATSGGGWTLAVKDMITRCQGHRADTPEIQDRILHIITSRNKKLIEAVLDRLPDGASGRDIWGSVDELIRERVERTLALEPTPQEILQDADTRSWQLD